jgi:cytoskeletal protein CcmA (bactofilin family)
MFEWTDEQEQERGTTTAVVDRLQDEGTLTSGGGAVEQEMTAHVGASTEFKGILCYDGTIRIDGKVEGEIHTEGVLLVGRDAVIRARVSAGTIVSCGRIIGDVTATEKISLLASAILKGSVKTPQLSLEEGARLIGTTDMPEDEAENSNILGVKDEEEVARAG